jgi:hypothetical protein
MALRLNSVAATNNQDASAVRWSEMLYDFILFFFQYDNHPRHCLKIGSQQM